MGELNNVDDRFRRRLIIQRFLYQYEQCNNESEFEIIYMQDEALRETYHPGWCQITEYKRVCKLRWLLSFVKRCPSDKVDDIIQQISDLYSY